MAMDPSEWMEKLNQAKEKMQTAASDLTEIRKDQQDIINDIDEKLIERALKLSKAKIDFLRTDRKIQFRLYFDEGILINDQEFSDLLNLKNQIKSL